jgi:hypothetical protein
MPLIWRINGQRFTAPVCGTKWCRVVSIHGLGDDIHQPGPVVQWSTSMIPGRWTKFDHQTESRHIGNASSIRPSPKVAMA